MHRAATDIIYGIFLENIYGLRRQNYNTYSRVAIFVTETNKAVTNISITITGIHSQSTMPVWFQDIKEFQQ